MSMFALVMMAMALSPFTRGTVSDAADWEGSGKIEKLLNELPLCSILRESLERHQYGDGIEQPYMQKMRQLGVKRALLEVNSVLRKGKPTNLQIIRRLYFRQYDGPNSVITDDATLNSIRMSDLPAILDEVAQRDVAIAPIYGGPDIYLRQSKKKSSTVELFSEPWLPREHVLLFSFPQSKLPFEDMVIDGDVVGTRKLLASRRFEKRELDRALFDAVLSRYDNTTVIGLLLDAGADVNARAPDGSTPLMSAVARPCNLRPLLDRGADLSTRNKAGSTALDIAKMVKQSTAIRMLEEAAAKRSSTEEPKGGMQ